MQTLMALLALFSMRIDLVAFTGLWVDAVCIDQRNDDERLAWLFSLHQHTQLTCMQRTSSSADGYDLLSGDNRQSMVGDA